MTPVSKIRGNERVIQYIEILLNRGSITSNGDTFTNTTCSKPMGKGF